MKQYKLIKEYPGSPKINEEIYNDSQLKGHYYLKSTGIHLGTIDPNRYPEFWEEVVEKDYEILSYIGRGTKNVLSAKLDPFVLNNNIPWGCKDLDIYSVKRLGDGEIFTVGDKVDNITRNGVEITKFLISDCKNYIQVYGDFIFGMNGWNHLKSITHSKKPLFTTEDGVGLNIGDLFYTTNTKYLGETWKCMPVVIDETFFNPHVYKNSFSTSEKCITYIEENKPQYSKKDMLNFCGYARGMAPWENSISCYNDWLNSPYNTKK